MWFTVSPKQGMNSYIFSVSSPDSNAFGYLKVFKEGIMSNKLMWMDGKAGN
jgi:hypothetical protein